MNNTESECVEKLCALMIEKGLSTGHAISMDDLLHELGWQLTELNNARIAITPHSEASELTAGLGVTWEHEAIKCLVLAFNELNSIRARDGAPHGVCPEYFSEVVNRIDNIVNAGTGMSAHCHPALYSDDF